MLLNNLFVNSGDSGGPLLIPDRPDGNLTAGMPQADLIVGVTSFGSGSCDASVPGVYTRISFMWEWIVSILDGQERQDRVSLTIHLDWAVPYFAFLSVGCHSS